MTCRICEAPTESVLDLGACPPANWLKRTVDEEQETFPLELEWCRRCTNLQLTYTVAAERLYRHYLYSTPRSPSLGRHYRELVDYLAATGVIRPDAFVVEMGSNTGGFLAKLAPHVGRVLGVDPAQEIAAEANASGVPTIPEFFTVDVARAIIDEAGRADLVVARHCLAHNASPHPMLDAALAALTEDGHLVIENAYALDTIARGEFDQIYHEHMFYFCVGSMRTLLDRHGLGLVDVRHSAIHGGSIVFVAARAGKAKPSDAVENALRAESTGITHDSLYAFADRARATRDALRSLVLELVEAGRSIMAYGATAKGTTLLNFTGLTANEIPYCLDGTEAKQGRFLPMSNVQVVPEHFGITKPPDEFLLTAWNYEAEIVEKVRRAGNARSRFIVPIPEVRVR